MSNPVVIATTKTVKRAWYQFAPKVVAALIAGISATVVVQFAAQFGIELTPGTGALISTLAAAVAGYIKSDTKLLIDPDEPKHSL